MTTTDDQVQRATDNFERKAEEVLQQPLNTGGDDPNLPQAPFPTALEMTREMEENVVEFALDMIDQMELEMGRDVTVPAQNTVKVPDRNTHLGKRELFTLRYYNHVEDRAASPEDSIYKHSNVTATISQRIAMQMVARANNYFFGTSPWYAATFIGAEDRELSNRIDRHSKWKFNQTGLKTTMEQATEFAFVRGEAVVKTVYETRDQYYKRKGNALHDTATGQPVLDSKGNYIFDTDRFVDEMQAAVPTPDQMAAGQPANPVVTPTGRRVLKRDPQVVQPDQFEYRPGLWQMKNRIFDGPDCQLVYYQDFLCPLSEPDIHRSPICVHLYDMPLMSLVEMFQREDLRTIAAEKGIQAVREAVEALRNLAGNNSEPKSGARQPRTDFGEQSNRSSDENPLAEVAECYLRYDVDGDGIEEEIMLVIDRANRFPIFYDYLANVTVKGRRPFEVVRAKPVDGRWYGMGAMEYFLPEQEFIDLLLNRKNFAMSKAGRITLWNPHATLEGRAQPHLRLNDGGTYTLAEGYKPEEVVHYIVLPEPPQDFMEMVEFMMQLMQIKSGIINGADMQQSGLPQSKTATGSNIIEKSGQELFAAFLAALEPGHKATLLANLRVLYANLQAEEVFRYFDGDMALYDTITPDDVSDLEFDVDILLTRVRTEQVLQMSEQAANLVERFYAYLPQIQEVVAPMFRDSLKALGYNNADDLIVPQPVMPMQPLPGAPGAQPPQQQPAPSLI